MAEQGAPAHVPAQKKGAHLGLKVRFWTNAVAKLCAWI